MSIVTTYLPSSLYWVYSSDGPTFEGAANGMQFRAGMVPGPVSGVLAERLCARGFKALDYRIGDQVEGWEHNPADGPGWFLRVGPPHVETVEPPSSPIRGRPYFPEPDELDWPDVLPSRWMAKIREYDRRDGTKRGSG